MCLTPQSRLFLLYRGSQFWDGLRDRSIRRKSMTVKRTDKTSHNKKWPVGFERRRLETLWSVSTRLSPHDQRVHVCVYGKLYSPTCSINKAYFIASRCGKWYPTTCFILWSTLLHEVANKLRFHLRSTFHLPTTSLRKKWSWF